MSACVATTRAGEMSISVHDYVSQGRQGRCIKKQYFGCMIDLKQNITRVDYEKPLMISNGDKEEGY